MGIDTNVAHSARGYNYLVGRKDNFAVDREAGDQMMAALPNVVSGSRDEPGLLARGVRFLVAECGIRQFLDIGTGIPSASNTHEVALAIAPETRIVYVDNDPIVLAHAQALLASAPEGAVAHLDADLRHLFRTPGLPPVSPSQTGGRAPGTDGRAAGSRAGNRRRR